MLVVNGTPTESLPFSVPLCLCGEAMTNLSPMSAFSSRLAAALGLAAAMAAPGAAQQAAPPRSAPLANLRYEITFDSATARSRTIKVAMSFDVAGPGPVLLSFPAWTPGAYELSWFARWVSDFTPTAGGDSTRTLTWDKLDYDTYRVNPAGAKSVRVRFDYLADTLDNAMAWARPNFALFNGTNLLPYPEGRGTDFPATVRRHDPAGLDGRHGHAGRAAAEPARTARATITTWSTSRSSSAASTTTAPRSPGSGPAWPPIPPAR